jgi:hypothetical protein
VQKLFYGQVASVKKHLEGVKTTTTKKQLLIDANCEGFLYKEKQSFFSCKIDYLDWTSSE